MELEELKARSATESTAEKEEELERLRNELIKATNLARQLFGSYSFGQEDPSAQMQLQLIDLNNVTALLFANTTIL